MSIYDKKNQTSYALGTTIVIELLKRRINDVVRVYIHPKQIDNEALTLVSNFCKNSHVPMIRNNEKIFKDLANKESCMMIAEFNKYCQNLQNDANHMVLVNPSNMGNLGTIIRSSLGFGIKNIALIKPCPDYFDPKVVRASMGAIFNVNIQKFESFEEYEASYPTNNLYPFMLKANDTLGKVQFKKPFSLIFGNEATGLPDDFLNKGTPVLIKISKEIDSLNLDNAVSIALFEATK